MTVTENEGATLELILQLATSGGFGALAWYLIAKAIPKLMAEFREDIKLQRQDFTAALNRIETQHREELVEMRGVTMQLVELVKREQDARPPPAVKV